MFNSGPSPEAENTDLQAERPDLCHKCGRCCRSATTVNNYQTLLKMVEAGEQEAIDFLSIFEPFSSIEEARKVVPDQVDQVLQVVATRDDMKLDEVTFYHCRYVTEEGLCGIYERRPRCCKDAPYHGWSLMPPGCGFEGWQFEQRERQKSEIRKLKEVQLQMEFLSPDGVNLPTREMTLEDLRSVVANAIKPWVSFGAEYW
jgi:Fe-S-cluster containining protein